MPVFFNKTALTEQQSNNWQAAVRIYARIQQENLERAELALQSQYGHEAPLEAKQRLRAMGGMHHPGPKSALFARLLNGKEPLDHPPPTSFSYPWYAVIEEAGPFEAQVDWCPAEPANAAGDGLARWVAINECYWSVVSYNRAAGELEPVIARSHVATGDELREVEAMRDLDPEWVVQHGLWPPFRLFLGRSVWQGQRGYVLSEEGRGNPRGGGNPMILRVLRSGEDYVAQRSGEIEALQRSGNLDRRDPLFSQRGMEDLRQHDPASLDWVEYACDSWHLQRSRPD